MRLSLLLPVALVGDGHGVEVAGDRVLIVDPLAQQWRSVDDVDGKLADFILVGEIAPQIVVALEPPELHQTVIETAAAILQFHEGRA